MNKNKMGDALIDWLSEYNIDNPKITSVKIDWNPTPDTNSYFRSIINIGNELVKGLSNIDDGFQRVAVNKLLSDPLLDNKTSFIYQVLLDYNFFLLKMIDPKLKKDLSKFEIIQNKILELVNSKKYVHFQWINSRLVTSEDWDKLYYELLTGKFENDLINADSGNYFQTLHDQLLALYFFYSTFLRQCKKISMSVIHKFDYALAASSYRWALNRGWLVTNSYQVSKRMQKVNNSIINRMRIEKSQKYSQTIHKIYNDKKQDPKFINRRWRGQRAQIIKQNAKKDELPIGIKQITNLMKKEGLD